MDSLFLKRLPTTTSLVILLSTSFFLCALYWCRFSSSSRAHRIPRASERVLILGASSGVGRSLVKRYASVGASVCAVARRQDKLLALATEFSCPEKLLSETADFTSVEDMVRVRNRLLAEWGGLDTVHIVAGVSALQPLLTLAGVCESATDRDATSDGITEGVAIARQAVQGNFIGPLVSALTFIPMLMRTSPSPSVLLVSSIAAVIPSPTRSLYSATKASSLLLFQSLAIEHPRIAFTYFLPATIEGDFRAGAVDSHLGGVRESDPDKHGLKAETVAAGCINAVDRGVRGMIKVPWIPYGIGHYLYYLFPSFVERRAREKYNFEPR